MPAAKRGLLATPAKTSEQLRRRAERAGIPLLLTVLLLCLPLTAVPAQAAGSPPYTIVDLGTLGGATSDAYGLNDAGDVVGDSVTATGDTHAFLYTGGKLQDLGTLRGADSTA